MELDVRCRRVGIFEYDKAFTGIHEAWDTVLECFVHKIDIGKGITNLLQEIKIFISQGGYTVGVPSP